MKRAVQIDTSQRDRQRPFRRYRVARIGDQMDGHLPGLSRVGVHPQAVRDGDRPDVDALAHDPSDERRQD